MDAFRGIKAVFITSTLPSLALYGKKQDDKDIEKISDKAYELALEIASSTIEHIKADLKRYEKDMQSGDYDAKKFLCLAYLLDNFCSLKERYEDKEKQHENFILQKNMSDIEKNHGTILKKELIGGGAETLLNEKLSELENRKNRVKKSNDTAIPGY